MKKEKISYSLITLSNLSTEYLHEIVTGKDVTDETKMLAERVLNQRSCSLSKNITRN
jgi:hypothetical protein